MIECVQHLKLIDQRLSKLAPFAASESMVRLALGDCDRACGQLRQAPVQLIEDGQLGRRAAVVKVETNAVVLFVRRKDTL